VSEPLRHADIPACTGPKIVVPVEKKTVLTTRAAERLAATLDRTVDGLGTLLLANRLGRYQDVRCLAHALIYALQSEACIIREQLERLQDAQPAPQPITTTR
jgi:hypothetical protein